MCRCLTLMLLAASLLLAACQSASTPAPTDAPQATAKPVASPAAAASPAASPASSPAVRASPSPSPAAGASAGGGASTWATIRNTLTSDTTLVSIGVVLTLLSVFGWVMANRAEATPNDEQLAELRRFVSGQFAEYVARGLAAEGVGPVAISKDSAWRKLYLQHLRLHNELYAYRKDIALRTFEEEIDAAVRRKLQELQAAGQQPDPAVSS